MEKSNIVNNILACLLLIAFSLTVNLFFLQKESFAAKKYKYKKRSYKRKYYRRTYYRPSFKGYQEMFLSPQINYSDSANIESTLKEIGVNSVEFNYSKNSMIVRYSAQNTSAVDIIHGLKTIGYTVNRIN